MTYSFLQTVLNDDNIEQYLSKMKNKESELKSLVLFLKKNHLLPLMSDRILRVCKSVNICSEEIINILNATLDEQKKDFQIMADQFSEIMNGCKDYLIPIKGYSLSYRYYPNPGLRKIGDLDFYLMDYSALDDVIKAMNELDYYWYDFQTKSFIDLDRKDLFKSLMYSHEINILKNKDFKKKNIDINTKFIYQGNRYFKEKFDTVLFEKRMKELVENNIQEIENKNCKYYGFSDTFYLLYLVTHIFGEIFLFDLENNHLRRDFKLFKLYDLFFLIVNGKINWGELLNMIFNCRCQSMVYFTFFYLNKIFSNLVSLYFMNEIMPKEFEYLNQYISRDEYLKEWNLAFEDKVILNDTEYESIYKNTKIVEKLF